MIIELSGIDGSGKSTLATHLMGSLNKEGIPTYLRSMPSMYKRLLAEIATEHSKDHWSEIFSPDQVELAQALEMTQQVYSQILPFNSPNQVIVTDTYTTRWLATAAMWGVDGLKPLADIYRKLPNPDLSIHIQIDAETAYQRITTRAKGDHPTKTANSERLHTYEQAFKHALAILPYPNETIDSTIPLDQSIAEVLALTQAALNRHPNLPQT